MTYSAPRILVLDDEPDLRALYELALQGQGYEVDSVADLREARQVLRHETFDVLISDMRLPDGLGLELVQEIARDKRAERCLVITAHGSAENAVAALKAGAFDYLTKPVDLQRLRQVVADALAAARASDLVAAPAADKRSGSPTSGRMAARRGPEPMAAKAESSAYALSQIVGESPKIAELKAKVLKVAQSMAPVLVSGESGTGKELVARALHACSHRSQGPFVPVNCAAIPENLLEAEFFGALKGSYTGASADRTGYFQQASGGTLFLDEIGELPLSMQSKLLRAIQERQVRAIGAASEAPVDVRIVSATHRNLMEAVGKGFFRQDLFYRVNVIELNLPPLRERREDLPALAEALLARIIGRPVGEVRLSARSLALLTKLPLQGNVRELENLLHRAWALADADVCELDLTELPQMEPIEEPAIEVPGISGPSADTALPNDLTAYLDAQERAILWHALSEQGFNRTAAANQLGISLRQMRYRIARLKIELPNAVGNEE